MKRRDCLTGMLAAAARIAMPAGTLALAGCGEPRTWEAPTQFTGPTMGTAYRVSLAKPLSPAETEGLRAGVEAALRQVDALMSTFRPESELSRFNAAGAGEWIGLAPDTATVIAEALGAAALTGGALDVTVGPLVDLWGFGPAHRTVVPSDEAIADAGALTGLSALTLDTQRGAIIKARAGLRVDLSGIAKGHAVDLAAACLDAAGVDSYLIDVGGELKARGRKAGGAAWRVGVERPIPGRRSVQRVLELDAGAIATSGDYRNFFERGGRRYSHTIDPRTGCPVEHGLASVSVLAERAMRADALSTALMVLGPEEGYALAQRLDLPALFLLRGADGIVERATPGFAGRLVA